MLFIDVLAATEIPGKQLEVSSVEGGPRGSWFNNIWSLEAERDEDLFIPGPQSRRTPLICKVGLPTFLNLI